MKCLDPAMFVDVPESTLELVQCSLGLGIFNDPVTFPPPCSHTFCRKCIETALKIACVCPLCKRSAHRKQLMTDQTAKKLIENFKVNCPYPDCNVKPTYEGLERHIKYCHTKPDVEGNLSANAKAKCKWCELKFDKARLSIHESKCPEAVITCPHTGCRKEVMRAKLEGHLRDECKEVVINCMYRAAGCTYSGKRDDMEVHYCQLWLNPAKANFANMMKIAVLNEYGAALRSGPNRAFGDERGNYPAH